MPSRISWPISRLVLTIDFSLDPPEDVRGDVFGRAALGASGTADLISPCSSFRHGLDGDIQALRPPNEPAIKGVEGIRLV